MKRIFFIFFLISLIIILPASALQVTVPDYVVKGDTAQITINGNPNEKVKITASFSLQVEATNGTYSYKLDNFNVPVESYFSLTAHPVNDLHIKGSAIFLGIPIPGGEVVVQAENGYAKFSQKVPAGTYNIEISGSTSSNSVTLDASSKSTVNLDSNGEYNLNYETSAIPLGTLHLKIEGESDTFEKDIQIVESIPTPTSTPTITPTVTPTPTTPTPTSTPTITPTVTPTPTTPTPTSTPTITPTVTPTPTTPTPTETPVLTPTITTTPEQTSTPEQTPVPTHTPVQTPTSAGNITHQNGTNKANQNQNRPSIQIPGFEFIIAIISLVLAFLYTKG